MIVPPPIIIFLMKANVLGESPSEAAAHRFFTKQLFLKQF